MSEALYRGFLENKTSECINLIVDSRTGLINSSEMYSRKDLPEGWLGWSSRIADTRFIAPDVNNPWHADPYSFGASAFSDDQAAMASIGEAVERYCGKYIPQNLIKDTWNGLSSKGIKAIEPQRFCLYSAEQYGELDFPFKEFTKDTLTRWVEGSYLDSGDPIFIPAPITFLDYYSGMRREEAPICASNYTGIAAGSSKETAVASGILELIERDTCALWWFRQSEMIHIKDWESETTLSGRLWDQDPTRTVECYLITNQWKNPVVEALVQDSGRELLTFGSACRTTIVAALEKAVVEAYAVLAISIDLADKDGPTSQAFRQGILPPHTYVAHRDDRSYIDDYPYPFRNMLDLPSVGQYYLDPRAQRKLLERFSLQSSDQKFTSFSSEFNEIEDILKFDFHPSRPLIIDLSTPDVMLCNLWVVRVIVPGWYGNSAPAFPLFGGKRLYEKKSRLPKFDLPLPLA